jgi:predicted NAD/FAD-binding protein
MNSLQNLETDVDYFVSIDYDGEIDREKIRFSTTYEHPLFDEAATRAKERLPGLNTNSRIRFCGSYFRDGFHEDALWSSLKLVDELIDEKGGKHEFLPL